MTAALLAWRRLPYSWAQGSRSHQPAGALLVFAKAGRIQLQFPVEPGIGGRQAHQVEGGEFSKIARAKVLPPIVVLLGLVFVFVHGHGEVEPVIIRRRIPGAMSPLQPRRGGRSCPRGIGPVTDFHHLAVRP